MSKSSSFALIPRDGIFCKDGRGWHTSASNRGHALDWPWPSTLLGALRSAWGRGEEARRKRRFERDDWPRRTAAIALGRTLALHRPHGAAWELDHRVWPVPADARWLAGHDRVHRLDPRPPRVQTLGIDDDAAREALWVPELLEKSKPEPPPRWWREADMVAWLSGESVLADPRARPPAPILRVQTHVRIDPKSQAADDGALYSHDLVETLERDAEWAIGVQVALPDHTAPTIATLGSDSRLCRVEPVEDALFDPPTALLTAFQRGSRGLRLVVVTPTIFTHGWLPDGFVRNGDVYRGTIAGLDLILRAAFVPRPTNISGWDIHKGSAKPTARAVAPGAVYFVERADGQLFGVSEARALWLAGVGQRLHEGFGRVIPGTWIPTPSTT